MFGDLFPSSPGSGNKNTVALTALSSTSLALLSTHYWPKSILVVSGSSQWIYAVVSLTNPEASRWQRLSAPLAGYSPGTTESTQPHHHCPLWLLRGCHMGTDTNVAVFARIHFYRGWCWWWAPPRPPKAPSSLPTPRAPISIIAKTSYSRGPLFS